MSTHMESSAILSQADVELMGEAITYLRWLGQHALDCEIEQSKNIGRTCDCGLQGILYRLTNRIEEANTSL
jgi:hypothetical protein